MTYIETGNSVRVYDSAVITHDTMPLGTYKVCFDQMSGYSLARVADLLVGGEKVYGDREQKVSKIFRHYAASKRSLGVMLSGDKGQGKSLFLREVAEVAYQNEMPVVVVTSDSAGLADFLSTLGECVIIFDEFEKVFPLRGGEGDSRQHQFLSLFDGLSSVKRIYCVTVNSLPDVSSYFVNRPGRFHYHLRFDYPTSAEVRQYLLDQAPLAPLDEIEAAVRFSRKVNINYDHLRAVAIEINDPSAVFADAIQDLNIKNLEESHCTVLVTYADGVVARGTTRLDLFAENGAYTVLWVQGGTHTESISFSPESIVYHQHGGMEVPVGEVTFGSSGDLDPDDYDTDEEFEAAKIKHEKSGASKATKVEIRISGQSSHSYGGRF